MPLPCLICTLPAARCVLYLIRVYQAVFHVNANDDPTTESCFRDCSAMLKRMLVTIILTSIYHSLHKSADDAAACDMPRTTVTDRKLLKYRRACCSPSTSQARRHRRPTLLAHQFESATFMSMDQEAPPSIDWSVDVPRPFGVGLQSGSYGGKLWRGYSEEVNGGHLRSTVGVMAGL